LSARVVPGCAAALIYNRKRVCHAVATAWQSFWSALDRLVREDVQMDFGTTALNAVFGTAQLLFLGLNVLQQRSGHVRNSLIRFVSVHGPALQGHGRAFNKRQSPFFNQTAVAFFAQHFLVVGVYLAGGV